MFLHLGCRFVLNLLSGYAANCGHFNCEFRRPILKQIIYKYQEIELSAFIYFLMLNAFLLMAYSLKKEEM